MKSEKVVLWSKEEYQYEGAYGFIPFMMTYLHDDEKIRPCMMVVPGGGYCMVSPTEGEIVAKKFYEKGYNAFVCTYSTNLTQSVPLKAQPMKDLSRAIRVVRKNATQYHIDPKKLVICGFSAGGHLCGSVCVHHRDIVDKGEAYQGISNRPDAAILSYPVITGKLEHSHSGSFQALYGPEPTVKELEYASLENHVTRDTPPCFLWQTATDETVPVENSYLFAKACQKQQVPYAHHVFSEGQHGLSLADEDWAEGRYGDPYTLDQIKGLIQFMEENNIAIPDEMQGLMMMLNASEMTEVPKEAAESLNNMKPNEEVRIWPELAAAWLQKTLNEVG